MTDFVIDNKVNAFVAKDGTKPSVAGNYGMHSNIYQVGVIVRTSPFPAICIR